MKKKSDEARKIRRTLSAVCAFSENTICCAAPCWTQYQRHKPIFNLIRQTIRPYPGYYGAYKEALGKFYGAARVFETSNNLQEVNKRYGELWDCICEFFGSKEYLGNYNPAFFHTKGRKEKEDTIEKVFELNIEKDLHEVLLHLLYKEMVDERYDNLRKLQCALLITKRWREYYKYED